MVTIDITMVIQMINMVVLMFLLNGILYKPIKKILKERSEKMQGMQNDVAKFEENARLRQEEVDAKMSKASGKAKAALDLFGSSPDRDILMDIADYALVRNA